MASNTSDDEKKQAGRAKGLFIFFVVIFGVCLWLLLALEFHWWPWHTMEKSELKTFEPLKWVFASLIGAALYLLSTIASYYPKIFDKKAETDDQDDFLKQSYWYISTLLKAPILTVVIMWLLTNLEINVGRDDNSLGIAIDFKEFTDVPFVMTGIAFVLGFYGRVARKQLDIIAKYLFTRAWALAEQGFEVVKPPQGILLLKDKHTFKTDPVADVVWTANAGTMEADTGTYSAPEEVSKDGEKVVIRAYLRGEPSATDYKEVTLKLFKISGSAEVKAGEKVKLSLETKLTDKLTDDVLGKTNWNSDASLTFSPTSGKETEFTAPSLSANETEKKVKVTSTLKYNDKDYKSEMEITVKKPA